jgi:ATP-binding cassette, subfamily B, bacterial
MAVIAGNPTHGKLLGDGHMNAVELLNHREAPVASPLDATTIATIISPASLAARSDSNEPGKTKPVRNERLRPLLALVPYVTRYRAKSLAALVALTVASMATLAVPLAVRRMIDFGFTADGVSMINSYFSVMILVVVVLALASASRLYLVTTLGERIVADLRRQVFAHLASLSPVFFDTAHSGELVSRLTADTTQIKAAVVVSISTALRNFMLFAGASVMMVVSSPRLSGFVLAIIPLIVLPLVAFGRSVKTLSRGAQDTLADASAYASELIGAIRTLQAFTNERLATTRFGLEVERAYEAACRSTRARAFLTAIVIFLIFASVVVDRLA